MTHLEIKDAFVQVVAESENIPNYSIVTSWPSEFVLDGTMKYPALFLQLPFLTTLSDEDDSASTLLSWQILRQDPASTDPLPSIDFCEKIAKEVLQALRDLGRFGISDVQIGSAKGQTSDNLNGVLVEMTINHNYTC